MAYIGSSPHLEQVLEVFQDGRGGGEVNLPHEGLQQYTDV